MQHTASLASTVLVSTVLATGLTVAMAARSLAELPHPQTSLAIAPTRLPERLLSINPQRPLAPTPLPGRTGSTTISSSRRSSECETEPLRPVRLISSEGEMLPRVIPLTLESRPTIFAFIPQSLASSIEIVIFDEDDTRLYEATFNLPRQTGIVGFPWPEGAPTPEIGRSYLWYVVLVCNLGYGSSDFGAGAWIQRQSLSPELTSTLDAMPARDRPTFLAEQGVWYDAISSLIQLRLAHPQNRRLQNDWNRLLTTVNLQDISQEPISWFEYIPFNPPLNPMDRP